MDDPSPEVALDKLRSRAEKNPTDYGLRFELAQRLCGIGNYSEAVPHLQAATRQPHCRPRVVALLIEAFQGLGISVSNEVRNMIADLQDDEMPPSEENDE